MTDIDQAKMDAFIRDWLARFFRYYQRRGSTLAFGLGMYVPQSLGVLIGEGARLQQLLPG